MWVFTKSGFFSAVRHMGKPGKLLVRARFAGDLERFIKAHGINAEVAETPEHDYRFRAEMDQGEFAEALAEEARAIDYPNFKNSAHDGTARDGAYMDCWCAMRFAQQEAADGVPKRHELTEWPDAM